MATLFLTCGLPGSGKTTLARRLEQRHAALRLTADEWLCALHPALAESELDAVRDSVERVQWSVALRTLELGCNVVVDWGLWSREERAHYRAGARAVGARVVLCLLDPPLAELHQRLRRRNDERPAGTFRVASADLDAWSTRFERPDAAELAHFDPL